MDKSTKKKKKKKSTNRLLEQMEFYFSDSNLRRDKFLREKLILNSTRKAINLSLFLNFNNIKAITSSVSDIKDALSSSTLLTVSVDNEELFVARKDWEDREDLHSFLADLDGNNQGFDKRTIYIENLPSNANQNWLRQLFSRFGKVNLVSVPKFKFKGGGQRIKQFCFIEFANEENLQSAMEYFKQFNGILCYDEADNLLSIHKFHEEEEELQQQQQQKQPKQTPEVNELDVTSEEKKTNQDKSQQAVKKSKRRNRKKKAPQVDNTEGETKVEENVQEQEQDTVEEEEEEEEDEDNSEKKSYPELNDNMIYDLKIMPKMEWKRLRNKYLNLQREMVREMKKQAYYRRMQMGHNNIPEVAAPAHQAKTGPTGIAPVSKKRQFEANDEEVAAAPVEEEGENGATKPKRRKRGREKKIKEAIKKSSHIFFDPPAD